MGECFLYGQGGANSGTKFATGTFNVVKADSNYMQTIQLSTEFLPDYIVIAMIGYGDYPYASTGRVGYTSAFCYDRVNNTFSSIYKRGSSSDSGATIIYTEPNDWSVKMDFDESSNTLTFTGRDGGYSSDDVFALEGLTYRWIMWKE